MNPKLILAGGLLIIILSLTSWALWERGGRIAIKADYEGFVAKAQILAAERLAENRRKEIEYQERLKTADAARTALLARLRDYQNRPDRPSVPGSPQTAGPDTICWSTERFDRGLRELEGIVAQGQEALIDLQTVIQAWPR